MTSIRVAIFHPEIVPIDNTNEIITFQQYTQLNNLHELYRIIREYRPDIILTIQEVPHPLLEKLNHEIKRKWIKLQSFDEVDRSMIERNFMKNSCDRDPNPEFPLISVITTSFKSLHRIQKPMESLTRQTYTNWEWVIFCDVGDPTPEDLKAGRDTDNWTRLNVLYKQDYRIRLFRSNINDGNIGSVKYNASMLARGDLILEMDHDDHLIPEALELVVGAMKKYPDAGFIYTESGEIMEENDNNWRYGVINGYGYCGYQNIEIDGKWRWHHMIAPLCQDSISHLIGMPNHIRAVRRELYYKVWGNCPALSVSDDYELMLKCFLETRFVRIPKMAYMQYRNTGGNNFTFLRNKFIQELCQMLYCHYYPRLRKRFKELGMPYGPKVHVPESDIQTSWFEPSRFKHRRFEHFYLPNREKTIDIVFCCTTKHDFTFIDIMNLYKVLGRQTHQHWNVLFSGVKSSVLEIVMSLLPTSLRKKTRWWNQQDQVDDKDHKLISRNYAQIVMIHNSQTLYVPASYIKRGLQWTPEFLYDISTTGEDVVYKDKCLWFINPEEYIWWEAGEKKSQVRGDRYTILHRVVPSV